MARRLVLVPKEPSQEIIDAMSDCCGCPGERAEGAWRAAIKIAKGE